MTANRARAAAALTLATSMLDGQDDHDADSIRALLDQADPVALTLALAELYHRHPLPKAVRRLTRSLDALGHVPSTRRPHGGPLAPCGTHSAYNRHLARGELIDDACRQGQRAYDAQRKRRTRRVASAARVAG